MDHELPNVIFALGSHLLELTGLIIIISIYQVYFLAGAVSLHSSRHPARRRENNAVLQGHVSVWV